MGPRLIPIGFDRVSIFSAHIGPEEPAPISPGAEIRSNGTFRNSLWNGPWCHLLRSLLSCRYYTSFFLWWSTDRFEFHVHLHRQNVLVGSRFGIKAWFNLSIGPRCLPTTPRHLSMLCAWLTSSVRCFGPIQPCTVHSSKCLNLLQGPRAHWVRPMVNQPFRRVRFPL